MASRKLIVEVVGDASSLERTFKKAQASTTAFGNATTSTKRQLGALAGGYVGVTGAALAFGGAVKASFSELFEAQKVAAQTEAVLRSTGFAAGVTAEDVDKLAQSLLKVSGVDDEVIKRGENLLLTFRNIRNEVGAGNDIFNQATKAALDMSVAMGEDMQSAVLRLGKALNDPVRGMTALRRVGVQFTAAQEAQIKASVRAGDTLAAQKVILEELRAEFGGSAEAAGKTLPGQLNKLRESARNLGATVANIATPALVGLTESANDLLTAVQNLNDPRVGIPSLGEFFKGLGSRLPAGSESIPTIGPFLGALRAAFHKGGQESGDSFTEGFADAVANSPRAEAAAARAAAFMAKAARDAVKKVVQPGTGTPFLDFQQATRESTKGLLDDLEIIRRRIEVLRGRLDRAGTLKAKTELQVAINQERAAEAAILKTLRDQELSRRAAAKAAAREAAERRREARERAAQLRENAQFRLLGLGPEGSALVPGVKQLRKQLGRLGDAVKGTFLDTGKTRSLLQNIRRLLAGSLGQVSDDVRRTIKEILDDIDRQLKEHESQRTKFRHQSTAQLLEGLGLTREQRIALETRLARQGPGGTTATGTNQTAFGRPVKGGPQTVNIETVHVHGVENPKDLVRKVQKEAGRRGGQRRGPTAGNSLGFNAA